MTHVSGGVYVVWSLLSTILFCFLISHLWKFDRFQCLKWNSGPRTGSFKRVMTFTYLLSLPLLIVYSVMMATVKYREAYTNFPGLGIIPTPYLLWSPENLRLITPLQMVFSVAWGLEITTHLEELMFWLFLIGVGPSHTSWFRSIHFKVWILGSLLGMVGIPLVTWFLRSDPMKSETYTFLAGGIFSLLITIGGLRVIWIFPRFLRTVKSAGGEPEVVIRLTTFHDLNIMRILFRFGFVTPMIILAVDGVHGHVHHINESALWTDLLATMAGLGMVVSSAMTLLIFFPRSIEREAGYTAKRKSSPSNANRGGDEAPFQPVAKIITPAMMRVEGGGGNYQTTQLMTQLDGNPFAASTPSTQQARYQQRFQEQGNPSLALPSQQFPTAARSSKAYSFTTDDLDASAASPPPVYDQPIASASSKSPSKRKEVWEMVNVPSTQSSNDGIGIAITTPGTSYAYPSRAGGGNLSESTVNLTAAASTVTIVPSRPARHEIHPLLMNYSSPLDFGTIGRSGPRLHRPNNAV